MDANPERNRARIVAVTVVTLAALGLLWRFPPFRIVSLVPQGSSAGVRTSGGTFDPTVAAARIWQKDLPAATALASDLGAVAAALRADPAAARVKYARASGLGAAYYFVRGRGRVVAGEGSQIRIAVAGDASLVVALRTGPVFGNTVRDGCGLLDVNSFPGLTEFNALAAALNVLVEKNVLPILRAQATVGAEVGFAGCAEAPDSRAEPGEPLLRIVPVQVEVRP